MTVQRPSLIKSLKRKRLLLGAGAFLFGCLTLAFLLSFHLSIAPDERLGLSVKIWDWSHINWIGFVLASIVYVVVGLNSGAFISKLPGMTEIYPNMTVEDTKVGSVQLSDIVVWTQELADKMSVEIRTILIHSASEPNAATSYSIGKGDLIFLNRNLLEICTPQGIKAIIAHELGHVDRADVFWKVLSIGPQRIASWWLLFICMQFGAMIPFSNGVWEAFIRSMAAMLFLFSGSMGLGIIQFLSKKYTQTKEYLADVAAAKYVSPEAIINSLLRVSARIHTLQLFREGLKESSGAGLFNEAVQFFPVGELSKIEIQAAIPTALVRAKLSMLERWFKIEIPEDEKQSWVEKVESLKPKLTELKGESAFAWKVFDLNKDGYLQRDEISVLIHRLNIDKSALSQDGGEHPELRQRILKVAQIFGIEPRAE